MALGERLRQIRRDNLLTQQDIANELHVSRQTVSGWETGRAYPDITSLITLAETYQLSLDALVKEDAAVTAELVRADAQRREARIVYFTVFGVDIMLTLLVYLNLFGVPGFSMSQPLQWLLVGTMCGSCLAVGPSQRRYRQLRGKRVIRTMTLGGLVFDLGVLLLGLAAIYLVKGTRPFFWGGFAGGVTILVVMVVANRVRFGPIRRTWHLN